MNRKKLIDAIMNLNDTTEKSVLYEALRYLSDTNLLALALELGINTDAILLEAI